MSINYQLPLNDNVAVPVLYENAFEVQQAFSTEFNSTAPGFDLAIAKIPVKATITSITLSNTDQTSGDADYFMVNAAVGSSELLATDVNLKGSGWADESTLTLTPDQNEKVSAGSVVKLLLDTTNVTSAKIKGLLAVVKYAPIVE